MCGIVGVISLAGPQPAAGPVVEAMANTVGHRGPDEGGSYSDHVRWPGGEAFFAMAHRRLSIVDLAGGKQPLRNETGQIQVIANAEIYNYPDLLPLLESHGHRLATRSDCEAIVHLYEDYGLDVVDHLNGMFAFALWDSGRRRLLLARDRMGVKPLYYWHKDGTLIFGSELKALLAHPLIERRVDTHALRKYLLYEYVPSPSSIVEGVRKLEAGQMLVWEEGRVSTRFYWDLNLRQTEAVPMRENECLERLDELFSAAVKRRLMSDVELGVFLSGGIDSSLVCAKAREYYGGPMKAFTIGFEDRTFDETRYAEKVARRFGMDFHHERLTDAKLMEVIPSIKYFMDEPLGDSSIIPTYLVSRLASSQLKVVLSGDGSDDILAGYAPYVALKMVNLYKFFPTAWRSTTNRVLGRLPVRHNYLSADFKIKQFMRGAGYSSEIMFFKWMGSFDEVQERQLLLPEHAGRKDEFNAYEDILGYISRSHLNKDIERILYLMMKLYLQDDILVKVDRASMANSLEVRSPFMDRDLVEFINQLPTDYKIRHLTTKYILKRYGASLLPKDIVYRKKKGFGIPIGRWFCNELRDLLQDYLHPDRLRREGFFSPEYVQRLVQEHIGLRADHRKQLFTLLMFEMWLDRWSGAQPASQAEGAALSSQRTA